MNTQFSFNSPTILITGGAGYIGSHTAFLMYKKGYKVIILDNFWQNQSFNHNWAQVIKGDFADKKILEKIFKENQIDAVMHFAAFIEVGESVKNPLKYYQNNVVKTLDLLEVMLKHDVKKFIFSSSCAIYGIPQYLPLDENHPKNPINPYGKCKLIIEETLKDLYNSHNLKFVSLRYFNAAGSLFGENLGERHLNETHLIPLLLRAAKKNKTFTIFGDGYKTKDGSCVRDFVHVSDIAQAHVLALEYLNKNECSDFFNLGTGNGFSVKEIVAAVEKILTTKIKIKVEKRREGDPAILVADSSKANEILNWKPKYSDLENILKSALHFENIIYKDKNYSEEVQKF